MINLIFMNEGTIFKTTIFAFGTAATLIFGGLDLIFKILVIFMSIDYLTGLMKGLVKKELSSSVGWLGLMRKTGVFLAVIVAHQMDRVASTQIVRTAVITFFIANEGISLVENLCAIGVPIPKVMLRTLKAMKENSEGK